MKIKTPMNAFAYRTHQWILCFMIGITCLIPSANAEIIRTEKATVKSTILIDKLDHPWGMAFLDDGQILITERSGDLLLFDKSGKNRQSVSGLPDIEAYGQGGLLDVRTEPDGFLYLLTDSTNGN